jgi:hypothetical protein
MTYSWTFKNLRVAAQQGDLADVMVSVDYRIGYTADRSRWVYHYGSVDFAPADPALFTEYASITEEQMIGFVEQTLGDELATIQTALQAEYANPITTRSLPWELALDFGEG